MTQDELLQAAIVQLHNAEALIEQARAIGSGPVIVIKTGDNIASMMDQAPAGTTFQIPVGYTWPDTLVCSKPVSLLGPVVGSARMDATTPLPKFLGGVTASAPNVSLGRLELFNSVADGEILSLSGAQPVIDQCRLLGDPVRGQHRGIGANAPAMTMRRLYIDYVFAAGRDTQAICGWNTPGPIIVDDCYLSAAAETVLFGGADPSSAATIPSDIALTNSTLTKRPEWRTNPSITVKNVLELKNARRVVVRGCLFEMCWPQGQSGYLIALSPRNQDGTAPYSTVEDVLIEKNIGRHACAVANLLGTDNDEPSQRMARVQIIDNNFQDIDPYVWGGGSDKVFLIGDGPEDTTIARNVVVGGHIGSDLYLYGTPSVRLTVTDNQWPVSTYGLPGYPGLFADDLANHLGTGTFTYTGNQQV